MPSNIFKLRSNLLLRNAAFALLGLNFICLPSVNAETTDSEEKDFVRHYEMGQTLLKSGDLTESIRYLKRAADQPHTPSPDSSCFRLTLFDVLGKAPLSPDAHIAFGLDEMNSLDLRYRRSGKEILGIGQLAEWEFRRAIWLSPDHKNDEAEKYLKRLFILREAAHKHNLEMGHSFKSRETFFETLIGSRWKPPANKGFLLARLETDWNSKTPRLLVTSSSKEFDELASRVLTDCLQEYPYLPWGYRHFTFVSGDGLSGIEEGGSGRSVKLKYVLRTLKTPPTTVKRRMEDFLRQFCLDNRLQQYCKTESQFAYKRIEASPEPDLDFGGDLGWNKELGSVTWRCGMLEGKAISLDISVGSRWSIYFDASKLPPKELYDDYVIQQRVRDALFSSMVYYQVVHFSTLPKDEWLSRRPPDTDMNDSLIFDNASNIVGYKCELNDGRTVTATLAHDHSIQSVLVDDQPDELWTKAYQECAANNALARKLLHGK